MSVYFFQAVDHLLRALNRGVVVEQRGVVRGVEDEIGSGLFGIGLNGGEDPFWIGEILAIRFSSGYPPVRRGFPDTPAPLFLCRGWHFCGPGVPPRRAKPSDTGSCCRGSLPRRIFSSTCFWYCLASESRLFDGVVVGVYRLEYLLAVDDYVIFVPRGFLRTAHLLPIKSAVSSSEILSYQFRFSGDVVINITLFFQIYCHQADFRTADRARSGTGCRSWWWNLRGDRIRNPSRYRAYRRRADRAARRNRPTV